MAEADPHTDSDESVSLLLLGDAGCGKSTFLARLKNGGPSPPGASNTDQNTLELLRDGDQPFIYHIRFSKKTFTLKLYDTSNPNQHWTSLRPDVVVITFDISSRDTLAGLKEWRNDITRYFQHGHGERLPVMMLGLKRDLRREGEGIIYPQEGYRIAQELRCDRYAECSAVTGELLAETFEDLARLAAMATTEKGGQTEGTSCVIL
ncbi:uncharacterized protein N7479_008654 [Penicillium vulpinum]|uniref:Rho-like small GTPase n=1 Tax=Penicillium vulpinum TaxID=29845 RepID=A0A1V6S1J2_9EURO|nr:uncharacterized protein N7479_008654 [Penicillium vulpinum]KAJ5950241.1 hypothetical protein N7479_008654 [Penicillium vulpinum]OQE07738.1 hypothetical protein PENVUL_c012G08406 [Penicillium vulpinum]